MRTKDTGHIQRNMGTRYADALGPALIVENCEPHLSEWLEMEYRNCVAIWGPNVRFTNVADGSMAAKLRKFSSVSSASCTAMDFRKPPIVLDPKARKRLKPSDFRGVDTVVIGGILGYEKMTGRTKTLITDRFRTRVVARNLGSIQLSIDMAAFIVKAVMLGARAEEMELTTELEIQVEPGHSVVLPYGYPVVDGKVIVTPGLVEYLRRGVEGSGLMRQFPDTRHLIPGP